MAIPKWHHKIFFFIYVTAHLLIFMPWFVGSGLFLLCVKFVSGWVREMRMQKRSITAKTTLIVLVLFSVMLNINTHTAHSVFNSLSSALSHFAPSLLPYIPFCIHYGKEHIIRVIDHRYILSMDWILSHINFFFRAISMVSCPPQPPKAV